MNCLLNQISALEVINVEYEAHIRPMSNFELGPIREQYAMINKN